MIRAWWFRRSTAGRASIRPAGPGRSEILRKPCESFEGRVDGQLVWPPRGTRGFGYDPIFLPDGESLTFGEMEPRKKHAMSHRAHAFAKLVQACLEGP